MAGFKPMGIPSYGSIGHIPGSRVGPGDHTLNEGQAKICTEKIHKKGTSVYVTEKLDGSNVSVLLLEGKIIPLIRAGYVANTSTYEQHHLFYDWVFANEVRFRDLLEEGERVCGEWLAQAHGTRYKVNCLFEPFHTFDIMKGHERVNWCDFIERICYMKFPLSSAKLVAYGPISIEELLKLDCNPWREDPLEGFVFRVENDNKFNFLAKWVSPTKVDGCYFPQKSGNPEVWNWRPTKE